MPRNVRYLPDSGALVEITQRTFEERFLFRPSSEVNAIFVGCLARAQKHTAAEVHAVAVMSDHFHLLASFRTVEQMARFMGHLKANLSKEINRLHGRRGPMYPGRYSHVVVTGEPEVQISRWLYLARQGTKEGLVASPHDWPGIQSAGTHVKADSLRGVWIDRTEFHARKKRGEQVEVTDVAEIEELRLQPLPAFAHWSRSKIRRELGKLVRQIERDTAAHHRLAGTSPLGAARVRLRDPEERAQNPKRSPRPRVHAYRSSERRKWIEAQRQFTLSYRAAAGRLAAGDREAEFPPNCYPPGLPFSPPIGMIPLP